MIQRIVPAPGAGWKFYSRNAEPLDLEDPNGQRTHVPARAGLFYVHPDQYQALVDKTLPGDTDVELQIVIDKPKREPLLIDRLMAALRSPGEMQLYDKRFKAMIFDQALSAKRFVLDAQASRYLGAFMAQSPEVIATAQAFAIPPFQKMWIELDASALFDEITHGRPGLPTADTHFGFLFVGPEVYSAAWNGGLKREQKQGWARDTSGQHAALLPLKYRLNKPASLAEENDICEVLGISRMQLDGFFWGEPGSYIREHAPEHWHALRANHSVHLISSPSVREFCKARGPRSALGNMFEDTAGDLRNIVALLLFLNRTSAEQIVHEVKPAHGIIERKPRPFLGHSVIRFSLNPAPRLKNLVATGFGSPKRLHGVRGHFAHNLAGRSKLCEHEWVEHVGSRHRDPEGRLLTWRCLKCPGLRWWKPEHQRGKLREGAIVSQYEVTA